MLTTFCAEDGDQVILSYCIVHESGQRDMLYHITVFNESTGLGRLWAGLLTIHTLRELMAGLSDRRSVTKNFEIQGDRVVPFGGVQTVPFGEPYPGEFEGGYDILPYDLFWALRVLIGVDAKVLVGTGRNAGMTSVFAGTGDAAHVSARSLRFSDSTNNIAVSVADAYAKYRTVILVDISKAENPDIRFRVPHENVAAAESYFRNIPNITFNASSGAGSIFTDRMLEAARGIADSVYTQPGREMFTCTVGLASLVTQREYNKSIVEAARYAYALLCGANQAGAGETRRGDYFDYTRESVVKLTVRADRPNLRQWYARLEDRADRDALLTLAGGGRLGEYILHNEKESALTSAFAATVQAMAGAYFEKKDGEFMGAIRGRFELRAVRMALDVFRYKTILAYLEDRQPADITEWMPVGRLRIQY